MNKNYFLCGYSSGNDTLYQSKISKDVNLKDFIDKVSKLPSSKYEDIILVETESEHVWHEWTSISTRHGRTNYRSYKLNEQDVILGSVRMIDRSNESRYWSELTVECEEAFNSLQND